MRAQLLLPALFALSGAPLVAPSDAHASPLELYGASTRSSAMAGALSASASGADAIFHNPGALTRARSGVSMGFSVAFDQAGIGLKDRPEGYDVEDLGAVTPTVPTALNLTQRSDSTSIGTLYVLQLGGVTSLGSERFRAGALLAVPITSEPVTTAFIDERERFFSNQLHYELLDQRVRRLDIEFGFAYRIIDQLSIGATGLLLPSVELSNSVYLASATDQENVDINLSQKQGWNWGFGVGGLWEVTDSIRLAATYRHEIQFSIDGRNEIQVRGLEGEEDYPILQTLRWRPAVSPPAFTLGGAADIGKVTLNLESSWTRWSRYVNMHGEPANFDDTISMRAGVELAYSDRTDMRAGFAWVPTPVPDQVGRTNYVDNSRIVGSFGAAHRFTLSEREFEIGWYAQMHALIARETDKKQLPLHPVCADGVAELCDEVPDDLIDPRTGRPVLGTGGLQTGNPGFPGWVSGGWLAAAGVDVRWLF